MCGIVGYVGDRQALPVLVDGLRRLEYRGYDSAGVAVLHDGTVEVRRAVGRLDNLVDRLAREPVGDGRVGIGHTRWATHGRPSDENAHPHSDCTGDFVVVHNGIIENHAALRRRLLEAGHRFTSETDTEVIAHLLEAEYTGDLAETVRRVVAQLEGAFALVIATRREPGRIVAVRNQSPLIVGLGQGENFVASDIPALLPHTRRVYVLEAGEMADVFADRVAITAWDGRNLAKEVMEVTWDAEAAEKGGYDHFMLKEIHEQPRALADALRGRIAPGGADVVFEDLSLTPEAVRDLNQVYYVACGTAYHAGLVCAHLTERLAGLPARAELASEFRYREPLIDPRTLVVAVSQSGETIDTLTALRSARDQGARVLGIVNVVGSSIARDAGEVIYTWAGPEIAVASTKAFTTQLVVGTLLAVYLGRARGKLPADDARELLAGLRALPGQAEALLADAGDLKALGEALARHDDIFYIGRGLDYVSGLEGQLKLKEISYIHAEAYPAGELKHGPLALIVDGTPVVAVTTQP
ncbi:MAG TPA: glutamine--fructose-6-phosphate transaminase (isomerizing), partial [Bacillota bacterium]